MNRLACFVLGSSFVLGGAAFAMGGCGSDDATIADVPDTGGSSSGTSGSSGGSSGSSSGDAATDGATGTDASKDASTADAADAADAGDLVSNPGKVTCGSTTCTVGTEDCCRTTTTSTCVPTGGACNMGVSEACDEKADCAGTDLCCNSGLTGTACKADCGPGGYQICKTDAECTGGKCHINKCGGFGGIPVTIVPSCTAIPQCSEI